MLKKIGWLLFIVGSLAWLYLIGKDFIYEFLLVSDMPLLVRVSIGGMGLGVIVLLIAFIQERLIDKQKEHYDHYNNRDTSKQRDY